MKHTSGPWTVGQAGEHGTFNPNIIFTEDGSSICQMYGVPMHVQLEEIEPGGNRETQEGLANARLVAGAPDMLDALFEIRQVWALYLMNSGTGRAIGKICQTAIEKAGAK